MFVKWLPFNFRNRYNILLHERVVVDAENGLLYNRTAVPKFPLPFYKVNIFLYDFEAVGIKERVSICELTAILFKIIRTSSNREVLYT